MTRRPRIGITAAEGGPDSPRGRAYADAVAAAGAEVVWLDPPRLREAGDPRTALAQVDAVLFSGGADIHPRRYGEQLDPRAGVEVDERRDSVELPLARAAWEAGVPVLGICRGIQTLNVALGGTLLQDLTLAGLDGRVHQGGRTDVTHPVHLSPTSRLADLLGASTLVVNSNHHQALRDVAPGLVVVARSPDGVIEAVEAADRPWVLAVQWHPERMRDTDPRMARLFEALVRAARR